MVFGQNAINIVIGATDKFSGVFKKANLTMQSFQKSAIGMGAIGAGIALGFGKAIKTSIDFESAFTGVRKTVELSEEGFADLEQRFKEITKTTPIAFEEISKIGELAGQLGVEGVDNLEKFTKTIADISVTTNLTAEEAATSFARIANVMGEPLQNVDRMASVVVDLGNNFATTEAEISTFAQRIAGAGKIVGLSTGEVFGISAALSSVGIEAEAGGTAVQTALLKMDEAVINGGAKLDVFANTAGMTSDEFSNLWETDAATAFEKFILGLGKQGDKAQGTLKDVGLGGIRTARSFLSLSNAGDLISETLDTQQTAWDENTAATEEAEKRYDTLQSKIDIAKNKFALLGDEIGDRLVPFFENILIPAIDKIIAIWDSMSPKVQNSILIFAGVTAVLFLIAAAIALITLVSSPWLLIIFGIAAAISLVIIFWKQIVDFVQKGIIILVLGFQILKDTVIIVWEVIKNAFIIVWNFIVDMFQKGVVNLINMINDVIKGVNVLLPKKWEIPIIPSLDISNLKGDLTDIGALRADLAQGRIETAAELTRRAGIEVNIENINGTDPTEMAEALQDKLDDQIST